MSKKSKWRQAPQVNPYLYNVYAENIKSSKVIRGSDVINTYKLQSYIRVWQGQNWLYRYVGVRVCLRKCGRRPLN